MFHPFLQLHLSEGWCQNFVNYIWRISIWSSSHASLAASSTHLGIREDFLILVWVSWKHGFGSKNPFAINLVLKGDEGYGLVSLCRSKKLSLLCLNIELEKVQDWLFFHSHFPLAHDEFYIVLTPSAGSSICVYRRRQFWFSNHFSNKAKS